MEAQAIGPGAGALSSAPCTHGCTERCASDCLTTLALSLTPARCRGSLSARRTWLLTCLPIPGLSLLLLLWGSSSGGAGRNGMAAAVGRYGAPPCAGVGGWGGEGAMARIPETWPCDPGSFSASLGASDAVICRKGLCSVSIPGPFEHQRGARD